MCWLGSVTQPIKSKNDQAQNYHTTGGVLFRMPSSRPDSESPQRDIALYKRIGELGEEVVGYPCRSVYETYPAIDDRGTRSAAGGFITLVIMKTVGTRLGGITWSRIATPRVTCR